MARYKLSYINRARDAALSGGAWASTLPLNNAIRGSVSRVARSVNAAATSTQFAVDLGRARPIDLIGLIRHNCTPAAQIRVTAGTVPSGADLYDSGWASVWPEIYQTEDLEWEDDNWWTGTVDVEDIDVTRVDFFKVLPGFVSGRYWSVYIDDEGNTSGYVQFGALWLGPTWTPDVNPSYGASYNWTDPSEVEKTLGGAAVVDERPAYREHSVTFEALTDAEAFGKIEEIQRRLGVSGELVLLPDVDDIARAHKRNIFCRLKPSPVEFNIYGRQKTSFTFEEVVG
ncbi:hypothetical protein [Pararhodospirillum photometricum]|uniref:hypothetical protein n=1 Tax=Pararhodospirillum photometricum TaxID=1084 RepID=UPI0012FE9E32|nr:hypothetical protein [Pararhodospirillum photometricum]